MDLETAQTNTTVKFPLLKEGEYDRWKLRIEQYFQVQDYALWDVIENGNSFKPTAQTTTNTDGSSTTLIPGPVTADEKTQKKNDVKARSMLLMTLPNKHLLTFNQYKEAKTLFAAIQTRFAGFRRLNCKLKLKLKFSELGSYVIYCLWSTANTQVSTASTQVSTANLSDDIVYAFLASQPNGSQLVHEDLEQIHKDDLEEMDLKWAVSIAKHVECFNYHKLGHFARECRGPRNQDNRSRNQDSSRRTINVEEISSKAMLAIDGAGFDWSFMADEEVPTDMALMAFSDSEFNKFEFNLATYKRGLASVEEQLVFYKKNELEKLKQEKESNQLKFENFDNASKGEERRENLKQINRESGYLIKPEFEGYGPKTSKSVSEDTSNEVTESPDASLVKELVSNDKSQTPRGNQRNWNNQKLTAITIKGKGWPKVVNTARPNSAVVNAVRANQVNVVKASACWVWRPTKLNSASITFKRHNYVDARGRSKHMTGNMSYLSDFKEFDGGYVTFGGGAKGGRITGKGTLKTGKLDFEDVYFVKELQFNLFSVSQMCDKKNSVLFTDTGCFVLSPDFKLADESQVLLKVPRKNNMYSVDMKNIVPKESLTCLVAKATLDESMLWHRRLGHVNFKTINKLVKDNLVKGLPIKHFENDQTCVACLKGKQHKASCKSKIQNSITQPLFMLHMDLFGPTFVSSLMNKKYCLVVTDDYSRFTWVFFLASKDETSGILKSFITQIENLVDKKVKIIRCDNGTEFKNRVMSEFCEKKGIKREFSVARTPQQNGVAERRNRTLIEAARTMLADSKLPTTFWAEAVNTACYVQNRVLVVKPHNKTPYELFRGRTPSLSFMKPFGCHVTILNTLDHLGKFDGKSDDGFFVGYSLNSDGPKWLFDIDVLTKSMNYVPVVTSTNSNDFVGTKESNGAGHSSKKPGSSQDYILMPLLKMKDDEGGIDDQERTESSAQHVNTAGPSINTASTNFNTRSLNINTISPTVPTTSLESTYADFFGDESELDLSNIATTYPVPSTPNTITHKDHSLDHIEAMQEELLQFKLQQVWTLVDLPYDKRAIGTKWVYKNKKDEKVARIKAIRLFLAYASFKDFVVYQMDVKSAFMYGKIVEEVYVCQPPGFEDPEFPDKVYKRGQIDKTLFIKRIKSDILLVQVYVDDIIFRSTKKELCTDFENLMHKKFEMSSMASTPMKTSKPLLKDAEAEDVDVHLYRSMISSLMYLTASRPDIMFVDSPFDLEAYTDSDYAGASLDRKSTIGRCQFFGGILISWQCKKQIIVVKSTTKAEYVAAASCYGQIRHHFIRDSNKKKLIQMIKIHIDHNVADLLLKAFDVGRFQYLITATVRIVDNGEQELTTTVDGKELTITEASVRRHIQLADVDAEEGKGSGHPSEPQPPPSTTQPTNEESIPNVPIPNVPDEAVYKDWDDRVERATTTAASLDAWQASGGSPMCQEAIGGSITQTRSERVPRPPYDSPLLRVNTLGSDEGSMTLQELTILCTTLSKKVESLEADLKQTKQVYGAAYTKIIMKVKKLENTVKTSHSRRRAKIVVSDDEEASEDSSKNGRMIEEIDQNVGVTLVTHTQGEDKPKDYTSSGRISTASRLFSTAEESVSTAGASMSVSTAGKGKMEEYEDEQTKRTKLQQEQERLGHEAAMRLQEELDKEERQRMDRFIKQLNLLLRKNGKTLEQELKLMKSYLGDYKQRKETTTIKLIKQRSAGSSQATITDSAEVRSSKRAAEAELDHEVSKRQKTNEASGSVQEQPEEEEKELSQEDLQQMMMVVPVEEVYVEALQVKYPIIDWEVYTEESRKYWKIIRVGNHTEAYQFFKDMLKVFDRDDLVMLWNLVKERFSSTKTTDDKERTLWVNLKRLFEPNTDDTLWKLQRCMHDPLKWRLYDTCGVHHVSTERGTYIFMLVDRLLVEQHSEMANELLRKIFIQANRPRQ
ncbi:putative ribonuclease H-like domain-containing protein [Tanacetum coccineum]